MSVVQPFLGRNVEYDTDVFAFDFQLTDFGAATADAFFTYNANGSLSVAGDLVDVPWVNPTSLSSETFYIRVILQNGTFSSGSSATNTWLQLNTNRTWRVTVSGLSDTKSANGTIELARNSSGSIEVSSGTFQCTASVENLNSGQ